MTVRILTGDCRELLPALPAESVHCVVTSPPYFGLRDYGTAEWHGDDAACQHRVGELRRSAASTRGGGKKIAEVGHVLAAGVCPHCGAERVDRQMGIEATPEEYIAALVALMGEVRRVLRNDGTLWLNLGDSYAANFRGNRPGNWSTSTLSNPGRQDRIPRSGPKWENHNVPSWRRSGQSIKSLLMIPARVALAMQADGWLLRSDIIYAKSNPMPESVSDRPTNAYEHVFLFAKSRKYFYDSHAVREADSGQDHGRSVREEPEPSGGLLPRHKRIRARNRNGEGRNLRNVWTIATAPFKEAHFATFPPDLVMPCIKAGTSERGCCSRCGAPWVRQLEIAYRQSDNHGAGSRSMSRRHKGDLGDRPHLTKVAATIGWSPSCKCSGNGIPLPCTVLDPFGGAGTVGLVAERLQRHSILIELNPKYAEMARERIRRDAPLLAEAAE